MPRIIYICGLTHSGSTLLDLLLGNHPKVVSLGEIHESIRLFDTPNYDCTCGAPAEDCDIWRPVFGGLHRLGRSADYVEKYKLVVDAVRERYGDDVIISDSSKSIGRLRELCRAQVFDIKVVFLVKDIRSYTFSQMERRHKKKLREKGGWRVKLQTSAPYNVWKWWTLNREFLRLLEEDGIEHFQLGYEELCFRPEEMMGRLCDHVGIEMVPEMLAPDGGEAHVIRGNRMRWDPDKLSGIRYDYRWLARRSYLSLLTMPFLGRNRALAYSHGRT